MPVEPRWSLYPFRVAVVKRCSEWHQLLREIGPDLRGRAVGIALDWPKWEPKEGRWHIDFSPERTGSTCVRVHIWPDGRWAVRLINDDGDVVKKLESEEPGTHSDSLAGMQAAFDAMEKAATEAILKHLREMVA